MEGGFRLRYEAESDFARRWGQIRPRRTTLLPAAYPEGRRALQRPPYTATKKRNLTLSVNVNSKIKKLPSTQRKRVEARAAALIAEEMTLRELRRARKLTQVRIAKALGVTQDSVSRLEKRSDLLLSTLRKTVQAMGGNLSLVAEFPDRAPVVLSGIAEDGLRPRPTSRRRVA